MALNIKTECWPAGREVGAEIGRGLLFAWWWLFLLELIQPGLVSLYLDLNLILILGLISFFLGKTKLRQSTWLTICQIIFSAILILGLLLKLIREII